MNDAMVSSSALMVPVREAAGKPFPAAQESQHHHQQHIGDRGAEDLKTSGFGLQHVEEDDDDDDHDHDVKGNVSSKDAGEWPGTQLDRDQDLVFVVVSLLESQVIMLSVLLQS